ncbi:hypothetical protein HII36_47255 [Nonomuraea sp. NN258]|uniref:hypothetical protein n=1 Tax=Nonomuraea antri TaxID=2730852 RepID=UPI00156A6C2B|nr:hypothetical protein [Nonomuraea antri]NRQ39373.1 hypothetical protein [Nonomuraea antri]
MEIFYARRKHMPSWPQPDGFDTLAVLDHRTLPDGLPLIVDERMQPVEPLCSWFRSLAYARKQPETMQSYAYIARRLAAFLAERGTDVLGATEADLVAYRTSRTELDERPVDAPTFDKEAVVINSLYTHLVDQGLIKRRPFRLVGRNQTRSSLHSGTKRGMQIRHITVEQYLFFRDVGFGGALPDGSIDETFRGWAPNRGRAGLELALLTGMRLQEWSTLLLPELGEDIRRPGEPVVFELQKCAKYELPREVYVPPAALDMVDHYVLLERPELVEVSARSLARRHKDLFVVSEVDHEQGRLHGTLEGRRRKMLMSAMDPDLRRRTVRETDSGVEPLAAFIGHGGQMLGPSSWDRIRKDAWRRMRRYSAEPGVPILPVKPWRFHDARHTFALQLLKYLDRLRLQQEARREQPRKLVTLAEHHALNPVLTVQRRLGHLRTSSTYEYLRYSEDPMNYVDDAFREWSAHDGATYAEIALRALESERKESADASAR